MEPTLPVSALYVMTQLLHQKVEKTRVLKITLMASLIKAIKVGSNQPLFAHLTSTQATQVWATGFSSRSARENQAVQVTSLKGLFPRQTSQSTTVRHTKIVRIASLATLIHSLLHQCTTYLQQRKKEVQAKTLMISFLRAERSTDREPGCLRMSALTWPIRSSHSLWSILRLTVLLTKTRVQSKMTKTTQLKATHALVWSKGSESHLIRAIRKATITMLLTSLKRSLQSKSCRHLVLSTSSRVTYWRTLAISKSFWVLRTQICMNKRFSEKLMTGRSPPSTNHKKAPTPFVSN